MNSNPGTSSPAARTPGNPDVDLSYWAVITHRIKTFDRWLSGIEQFSDGSILATPATGAPTAGERLDALVSLGKTAFERRASLEEMQWKLNFSLWAAMAGSAWALRTTELGGMATGWFLLIPVHFLAILTVWRSMNRNVDLGRSYMMGAETLIGYIRPDRHSSGHVPHWNWLLVMLIPTLLLAIAGFFLTK